MNNVQILNSSQTKFFNATREALETSHGSNIRPSLVTKFITNQFRLDNEHLIPSLFNAEYSKEQLIEITNNMLNSVAFLEDYGLSDACYIDNNFEVPALTHDDSNVTVDFTLTVNFDNLDEEDQQTVYFTYGKNYGEGNGIESAENFYLDDIPHLFSGAITLADGVTDEELQSAFPMLMQIYVLFMTKFELSKLVSNVPSISVSKPQTIKKPTPKPVEEEDNRVYFINLCYFETDDGVDFETSAENTTTRLCKTVEKLDEIMIEMFRSAFPDHDGVSRDLLNFKMVEDKIEEAFEQEILESSLQEVLDTFEEKDAIEALDWLVENFDIEELAENLLKEFTQNQYELSYDTQNVE